MQPFRADLPKVSQKHQEIKTSSNAFEGCFTINLHVKSVYFLKAFSSQLAARNYLKAFQRHLAKESSGIIRLKAFQPWWAELDPLWTELDSLWTELDPLWAELDPAVRKSVN